MGDPHGVAIVGLGNISGAYLETLGRHPAIRIAAVADLDRTRADAVAAEYGAASLGVDDALTHPDVETVLNLTIPAAHAEIALAAVAAGRNVYGEKPLTRTLDEADRVLAAADATGVRVGCAPDTVLGTGIQTARAAVDAGMIGRPLSATATWFSAGHEQWHPNPDFYYRDGGGPLLDMGPYYVTALVHLLGPVESVQGAASRARDLRTIAQGPRAGETIPVEVATHVTGVLEHASGALSTVTLSFDGVHSAASPIEVHGTDASLSVPDPNGFDGEVRVHPLGASGWEPLPPSAGYAGGARGIGLLDFVATAPTTASITGPSDARAGGRLARHVLEVMLELLAAAADGGRRSIRSAADRPELVPLTPRDVWSADVHNAG